MITLKIPEGDKCKGCMFMDIDFMHNYAKCQLFANEPLSHKMSYGGIETATIRKLAQCPTDEQSESIKED